MTQQEIIVAACKKHFNLHRDDCSGFVRAVTAELGYPLTGDANAIVGDLTKNWTAIDRAKAIDLAKAGTLVVAGLKSADHHPAATHGHVVIVIDGPLYHDKYPRVWGGSIGSAQSQGTKTIGEVWARSDRDAVLYFTPKVAAPAAAP